SGAKASCSVAVRRRKSVAVGAGRLALFTVPAMPPVEAPSGMRTSGLRGAVVGGGGAAVGGSVPDGPAARVVAAAVARAPGGPAGRGGPGGPRGPAPGFGAPRRAARLSVVRRRRMLVETKPVRLAPKPGGLP